jgi:hypothetical protein
MNTRTIKQVLDKWSAGNERIDTDEVEQTDIGMRRRESLI